MQCSALRSSPACLLYARFDNSATVQLYVTSDRVACPLFVVVILSMSGLLTREQMADDECVFLPVRILTMYFVYSLLYYCARLCAQLRCLLACVTGFVGSPAIARSGAPRVSQNAARSFSSTAARRVGGVLMAAPETYKVVVVR